MQLFLPYVLCCYRSSSQNVPQCAHTLTVAHLPSDGNPAGFTLSIAVEVSLVFHMRFAALVRRGQELDQKCDQGTTWDAVRRLAKLQSQGIIYWQEHLNVRWA